MEIIFVKFLNKISKRIDNAPYLNNTQRPCGAMFQSIKFPKRKQSFEYQPNGPGIDISSNIGMDN